MKVDLSKHTPAPWKSGLWAADASVIYTPETDAEGNEIGDEISNVDLHHGELDEKLANLACMTAGPELYELVRQMMAHHRAQLPVETQDLYGGGCGCPLCQEALAIIERQSRVDTEEVYGPDYDSSPVDPAALPGMSDVS
jgi:hypothetical protein